jgi:hypothetical protein
MEKNLDPGSGMEKNSRCGRKISYNISKSLVTVLWVKYRYRYLTTFLCGSGSGIFSTLGSGARDLPPWIRDPGWKNSDRDKHLGSATLKMKKAILPPHAWVSKGGAPQSMAYSMHPMAHTSELAWCPKINKVNILK